ncbi:DNA-binding transcriptional regulator, MarR family [Lutibacter oricola]|uniref:DNA-binding transcriptional regulator, MarR family n=1 Tax=Lutibacter oricola TaxID=762486 RepID=A0A1H2XJF1_9FLAO|nr:MarR family transcriptional regulator [Lutibacter oricola]SDW92992.1 DNA-binding transcriptional regulator, MarR family [Lutibacter oricola]
MNKKGIYDNINLPDITINNLLITGNWMNEVYSVHLKQYALSIQQYQVLRSLRNLNGEPANLQTLQELMVSKNSNTTRLVEKLRLKGLITRIQNEENRRKVEIRITKAGLQLLSEIDSSQEEFEQNVTSNLRPTELIALNQLLKKIRNK